jgi:XTP/dITP diphosphohydrolase
VVPLMRAVLASQNLHKLGELRAALPDWQIDVLEADGYPEETGLTYRENALIKARYGRRLADPELWVLGEDSGIESAALGGAPGLHSARWAPGRDQADALLERLEGTADRRARMVTDLVAIAPDGTELGGHGVLDGELATGRRGQGGFGYDPIFIPDGETRTVAEIGDAWKHRNSHRAHAAIALVEAIARASASSS